MTSYGVLQALGINVALRALNIGIAMKSCKDTFSVFLLHPAKRTDSDLGIS